MVTAAGAKEPGNQQGVNSNQQVSFVKQNQRIFATLMVYMLSGKESNASIELRIFTDNLIAKTYLYNAVTGRLSGVPINLSYNGQLSTIIFDVDCFNIVITSYRNGLMSGNFNGKLTPYNPGSNLDIAFKDQGAIVITEGQFKNIKCFYK